MEGKLNRAAGIPMRELEKISGFARTTINFYIKEGLLPLPRKSAKNMSYYDERFVARLREIHILKDEGHFSLHEIKDLFAEQNAEENTLNLRFMKCLNSLLPYSKKEHSVTREEIFKETDISGEDFDSLEEHGFVTPADGGLFPEYALTVCRLMQFFISFGVPLKLANRVVEKLGEIVDIENEAFSTYIWAHMRGKNLSFDEKLGVVKESFETVNALLPILHLQVFRFRPKPGESGDPGPTPEENRCSTEY